MSSTAWVPHVLLARWVSLASVCMGFMCRVRQQLQTQPIPVLLSAQRTRVSKWDQARGSNSKGRVRDARTKPVLHEGIATTRRLRIPFYSVVSPGRINIRAITRCPRGKDTWSLARPGPGAGLYSGSQDVRTLEQGWTDVCILLPGGRMIRGHESLVTR